MSKGDHPLSTPVIGLRGILLTLIEQYCGKIDDDVTNGAAITIYCLKKMWCPNRKAADLGGGGG